MRPGGCSQQSSPTGKPEPFGVGGGTLNPSPPATANPAGNDGTPAPSGQQTGTDGTEVAQPHLSYKITSKWQGGFWGQIIITFPGAVPASWHLRFGYPGGHILGMNPDSHLAPNGHAAVVRSSDYAAARGRTGGPSRSASACKGCRLTRPGARSTARRATSASGAPRLTAAPAGLSSRAVRRVTLPALMHEVHTCRRRGVPSTLARTVWILGLKRRGVRWWERETLLPNPGPLPQMSQTEATPNAP